MFNYKVGFKKNAIAKNNFFERRCNATVLSATAVIAIAAILVSRAVVSSDLKLAENPQQNPENSAPLVTTVVTHHHSRILSSLGADAFSLMSRSAGSLSQVIATTETQSARYLKKTYTSTLPATGNQSRTIELVTTTPMFQFSNVGFPHIETSRRLAKFRYKPYQKLIEVKSAADGTLYSLPNVRCHGYSAEKTEARAARYESQIKKYAERYKVDFHMIKAVIAQESCYRNHVVSSAGAMGLMQLMPATAKWLGVNDQKSSTQNLKAGIRYLGQLTRRFDSPELALAAYNAGPGNVQRYSGIPPFKETQQYVRKVIHNYHSYSAASRYNAQNRAKQL